MGKLLALAMAAAAGPAAADALRVGHGPAAEAGAVPYLQTVAREYGLRLEERVLPSDATLLAALAAGEVDAAIASPETAIAARAGGAPVVLVAGFARTRGRILARKELGAVEVAGLAGHRVGVPRGGSSELLLLSELRAASLTWSDAAGRDVQVVYLPASDLNSALRARYVDAIVQCEPLATRALQEGQAVELRRRTGARLEALLTSERVYRERRAIERLLRSLVTAARIVDEHRDRAAREPRQGQLERELWREEYQPLLSEPLVYDISPAYVEETALRMRELGLAGAAGARPAGDLVRLDLLAEAVAGARAD
jgi:NitT/TauT family transport system substrate-binding protein